MFDIGGAISGGVSGGAMGGWHPGAIAAGAVMGGFSGDLSGANNMRGGFERQSAHAGRLSARQDQYQQEAQALAGDVRKQYNPFQADLMKQMALTASGQGTTAASAMLEASRGQNMANWNAMMASQRGMASPGMAAHTSANQLAMAQQGAASQIAPMAIQERQQAQGNLANMIGREQQYEMMQRAMSQNYLAQQLGQETINTKAFNEMNQAAIGQQNAFIGNLMNAGAYGYGKRLESGAPNFDYGSLFGSSSKGSGGGGRLSSGASD
jgi:hypothetical protein